MLDAAVRLASEGKTLTVPEVAEAALVSTATAYRYFPNTRALMFEVATRQTQPELDEIVAGLPVEPADRIAQLVSSIADFQLENESLWRAVLGASLERWFSQTEREEDERVPVRGSHRIDAVDAALSPLRDTMAPELYRRLTMATMLVCGIEALVSARDACGLEPAEVNEVMRWAARALHDAAVREAGNAAG